jgi:hypothetical protein
MLETITSHIPAIFSGKRDKKGVEPEVAAEHDSTGFMTDAQGRTKGLEDGNNPKLKDNVVIFSSSVPIVDSVAKGKEAGAKSGKGLYVLASGVNQAFVDPTQYGGSELDKATTTNLGEPLNVIISGLSSATVLTSKGLQSYLRSLNLDFECFGLHLGTPQQAWVDSRGYFDQQFEYRQVYSPLE